MLNFLEAGITGGDMGTTILMMVAMLGVFYFMLIRPENKRKKEAEQMRESLKVGDEVTTIGGIVGEIVSIKEETVIIETGRDHVRIRFLRSAVRCVDVPASSKNTYRINTSEETEAPEEDSFEKVDETDKSKKDKKKNKK